MERSEEVDGEGKPVPSVLKVGDQRKVKLK